MDSSCRTPFCPNVMGMPSFECLKFKDGKPKETSKDSRNFPIISDLFHKQRMHDICLKLNARMILEWPVSSINLAAAEPFFKA